MSNTRVVQNTDCQVVFVPTLYNKIFCLHYFNKMEDKITLGDYIVIQRQKYTKLHKFGMAESTAMLAKDVIELRNIESQPYSTTFRMLPKEGGRGKRTMILEPCTDMGVLPGDVLSIRESGADNRNIIDNGQSQALNAGEIEKLRDECKSSSEIVSQIVENSKTFSSKTEYSQEKYLKKKEKKYFEFVQIRRPNIRLITDVMYRQCPEKIMGMRMDALSQLISYSGISGIGNHLVYESGTNGLVPAALLNSIGAQTGAHLIHMHPGNVPQKQALLALNLAKEQLDRCISVNIYSILRQYYQNSSEGNSGTKRKIENEEDDNVDTQPSKLQKNDSDVKPVVAKDDTLMNVTKEENSTVPNLDKLETPPKKHQWMIENELACTILKQQVDSLVIVAKEHPSNIVKALLPFVKPSRPIVIFSLSRELLMEMYVELKSTSDVTNLRITSNWLRMYQVLPNRTHPDVNMGGNSGFLLTGYTIR